MRQFKPKLLPSVFSGFFLIVFIVLGCWQIQRYHYKQYLQTTYTAAREAQPIRLDAINTITDKHFKAITLKGHYLPKFTALLQHRMHNGRNGLEVLTAFQPRNQQRMIWVNRGWIPTQDHNKPDILNFKNDDGEVTGYIKLLDEYVFTLGTNILNTKSNPFLMQKIDIKELQRLTGHSFYPFIVRLNPTMPHGFVRDWAPINVNPSRHMGYAVQWFAMAFALLIAFIAFSLEKENNDE